MAGSSRSTRTTCFTGTGLSNGSNICAAPRNSPPCACWPAPGPSDMIEKGIQPGGERDETVVSPPPPTLEYSRPETGPGTREDAASFNVGVFCGILVPLLLGAEALLVHELYAATGRHPGVPVAAALAGGLVTWLALRFMRAS